MVITDVIEKVKVLELKDGDIVILKVQQQVSEKQLKMIKDLVKQYFEPLVHNKVLVLEEGMDIEVLRKANDKIYSDK